MTLHAKGIFPGNIPQSWLVDQDLFLCKYCLQLVANSRHSSHLHHCGQNSQPSHIPITGVNEDNLPSFEELCDLKCPTLRFVPHKSRAAFARALSSTLRSVINDNSEQAWLKFSKCVLPSSKRKGRHHNPASVDFLCDLWSKNAFATLWNLAKGRANSIPRSNNTSPETSEKIVQSAVSLARDGLLGKACRVLLSEGLEMPPGSYFFRNILLVPHQQFQMFLKHQHPLVVILISMLSSGPFQMAPLLVLQVCVSSISLTLPVFHFQHLSALLFEV